MPFDPLENVIDLRDAIEAVGDNTEDAEVAGAFLRAMVKDLSLVSDPADWLDAAARMADDEPTVIARRYFVEYAQELAEDLYALPIEWPLRHIDWIAAAQDLEQDYSSFYFNCPDGLTREYLIRSV